MKKSILKIVSVLLLMCLLPTGTGVLAADDVLSLQNQFIRVEVSGKNGGFIIATADGDKLKKDDSNKNLLFHSGEYDTSFTSFRITDETGGYADYIFGGDYGFLGLSSSNVTAQKDETGINAVWTLDSLTFTQRIELSNSGTAEHGMVHIKYSVKNSGKAVKVAARVLMDTMLGSQDFGYYYVPDSSDENVIRTVKSEQIITGGIPETLYATDSEGNAAVTAYTVSPSGSLPYQVAFGHWNNLAASVFEFNPNSKTDFTNPYNADYLTADSAYALFYDMGSVSGEADFSTYYGVYSHENVPSTDKITIDVTAPTALTLNADRTQYNEIPPSGAPLENGAVFAITANVTGFSQSPLESVCIAVYAETGLSPISGGTAIDDSFSTPCTVTLDNLENGKSNLLDFQFKAAVDSAAKYRKIIIRGYDVKNSSTLTQENMIGSKTVYILCPGGDGDLPQVTFTSGQPEILYCDGLRHFIATGTNFSMLGSLSGSTSHYSVKAVPADKNGKSYDIAAENISFPEENSIDIMLSEKMQPGIYSMTFIPADGKSIGGVTLPITAPALKFTVSDDVKYKNDVYGVLAIYQEKGKTETHSTYKIKSLRDEAAYQTWNKAADFEEILMVLRGDFVPDTRVGGEAVSWTAKSISQESSQEKSRVNINDSLDFENGTIVVHYGENKAPQQASSILVDMDGSLYTTGARTSVWKGKAAFTSISNGEDFSLKPYDHDGKPILNFNDNTISLVWPSGFGVAQTLGGMVFDLSYGVLGTWENSGKQEMVLSFTANLDLGFIVPGSSVKHNRETSLDDQTQRLKDVFALDSDYISLRSRFSRFVEEPPTLVDESIKDRKTGDTNVVVNNILFGAGKGFIGVRFDVNVGLPPYTEAMPVINAKLSVNTIGNWSFGVAGKCSFTTIDVEVDIQIKSHNNIPVPDKLYFSITGFEPGINVDGFGVLWITGGGGGIDKLYDTIFASSTLPPLKILLTITFDVLKVLSARADLSLSLRGLAFTASNVKIKATELVAIKKAGLEFNWYPDWYFQASVNMSLLDVITGSGYIVVIDNDEYSGFVEFFVRAKVKVPSYIPIAGGQEVGGVDLGLNNDKIWGALEIIGIRLGIMYEWGGDFKFGSSSFASPTFPSLLGYDETAGDNLYLSVGTNLENFCPAAVTDGSTPVLMGGAARKIVSDVNRRSHTVNLGVYENQPELLTVTYAADSLSDAVLKAKGVQGYTLRLANENAENANANVTWDWDEKTQTGTKKATLALAFTQNADFGADILLSTPFAAELALSTVASMGEITSADVDMSSGSVQWSGTALDKISSVSFYLTQNNAQTDEGFDDAGTLLGSVSGAEIASGAKVFKIPAEVKSGNYYLRAVYSTDGKAAGTYTGAALHSYTCAKQPQAPQISAARQSGDYTVTLDIAPPQASVDGYITEIINSDGETVDAGGSVTEGPFTGAASIVAGGAYSALDSGGNEKQCGLSAGTYTVKVSAYKEVGGECYTSTAAETQITVTEPNKPDIKINYRENFVTEEKQQNWDSDGDGTSDKTETLSYPVFKTSTPQFTVDTDAQSVSGTWTVDGEQLSGLCGEFTDKNGTFEIAPEISDGDHILTVSGKNSAGDSFQKQLYFGVDTASPTLLVSSPVNGSIYKADGKVTVSFVTEPQADITVACGDNQLKLKTAEFTYENGVYTKEITVPDLSAASCSFNITAADNAGNESSYSAVLVNEKLSKLKSLDIAYDGVVYTNKNLLSDTDKSVALSLIGNTDDGRLVLNDERLIVWNTQAVEGSADIGDGGVLTLEKGSTGYVVGALRVLDASESTNGVMTAAASFGAEKFQGGLSVTTGASAGGTTSGDGYYRSGDTVTVTATAQSGYEFEKWVVSGIETYDSTAASLTFTMPGTSVIATAAFKQKDTGTGWSSGGGGGGSVKKKTDAVTAKAGELVKVNLPADYQPNKTVVCYDAADGKKTVRLSAVIGSSMVFVAPVSGTYYFSTGEVKFDDISGHWAENTILLSAAKTVFDGVGNGLFEPDLPMTRAMFVTALYRMVAQPELTGDNKFTDVSETDWYHDAVLWAAEKKIAEGVGGSLFMPQSIITREQMCAVMQRFITAYGYSLKQTQAQRFADYEQISPWAKDAAEFCQKTQMVTGKENNMLEPSAGFTRAEACTVISRAAEVILNALSEK